MVGTGSGDLYEGRALGAGPLDRADVLVGRGWDILCGDLSSKGPPEFKRPNESVYGRQ
jgi:hypothetical protein